MSTIMKCKKAKKVTFSKDYRFARGTQLINHSIMSKVNKNSRMKQIIMSVIGLNHHGLAALSRLHITRYFSSTYLDSKLKKIL